MENDEMELDTNYEDEMQDCLKYFVEWSQEDQIHFMDQILQQMCHYQHGQVNQILSPILKRDFIGETSDRGFPKIAEHILLFLNAEDLLAAEQVSHKWATIISRGMIWKKLIERKVAKEPVWRGLVDRFLLRNYVQVPTLSKDTSLSQHNLLRTRLGYSSLTSGKPPRRHSHSEYTSSGHPVLLHSPVSANAVVPPNFLSPLAISESHNRSTPMETTPIHLQPPAFYRDLYSRLVECTKQLEENWRLGRYELRRINCHSENSKGVYCLQYDEDKIICGLRDNTIKVYDKRTLECVKVLNGHTGSVLCLQYDERIIVSGSSDSTVRVWSLHSWECVHVIYHHCEAVLHLRFIANLMVTCSKDRSIAVWEINSPKEFHLKRVLVGHRAAVNVIDFDQRHIVSASGDRTIRVWNTASCEFVRTLQGHRRGIACLQYRGHLVVSGSSDTTIRLWDIDSGSCLRVLEGHNELVRCIRFDGQRIVSGAYDGEIKVWDMKVALKSPTASVSPCIQTLVSHSGRVFRLHFDDFQIVSSSHDDTILVWDFLPTEAQRRGSCSSSTNLTTITSGWRAPLTEQQPVVSSREKSLREMDTTTPAAASPRPQTSTKPPPLVKTQVPANVTPPYAFRGFPVFFSPLQGEQQQQSKEFQPAASQQQTPPTDGSPMITPEALLALAQQRAATAASPGGSPLIERDLSVMVDSPAPMSP